MTRPSMLVANANGKIGFHAAHLLAHEGFKVRALIGHPSERSRLLERAGIQVLAGSLEDAAFLDRAFDGIQRAFFCTPWSPRLLSASTLFAAMAQEHRLEAVVTLSQWLADPANPSSHTRDTWLADRVFSWMPDVGAVVVNPGFFADNYLVGLEPIAQFGLFLMPLGEGLNAPPSNEDIARVVAGILRHPGPHLGRTYRPTGPALLSPHDLAGVFAKVLQRRVVYRDIPWYLMAKVGKGLGLPAYQLEQLRWYMREYQENAFAAGGPTDVVETIGGRPPEDFESILRRRAAQFPHVRRTPFSMIRAVAGLTRAMLTPLADLEGQARTLQLPSLPDAPLAVQSLRWAQSHGQPADPAADPSGTSERRQA